MDITRIVCRSFSSLRKALTDAGFTIYSDLTWDYMTDEIQEVVHPDPTPGTDWGEYGWLKVMYTKCSKPFKVNVHYFFDSYPNYMVFSYINLINDGIMCCLESRGGSAAAHVDCSFGFIGPSGDSDWVCIRTKSYNYWWNGDGKGYIGDGYTTAAVRDATQDKMDVSSYLHTGNGILIKTDEDAGFMWFNPNFIPMPTPNSIHLIEYYMPEDHVVLNNVYACKQVPAYVLTNRFFYQVHTQQYNSIPDFSDSEEYSIPSVIYSSWNNQHWADIYTYGTGPFFGERVKIDEQIYCVIPSFGQYYNGTTDEDYSDKSKYTNYACFAYRIS